MGNRGRKRKLKISELVDVKQKISEGAFKLNTLTMPEVRTEMQKTILEKNGINSHADRDKYAPLSQRTVASYVSDMMCQQVIGKIQAASRVDPFNDIKNCMAKAAGMSAINEGRRCIARDFHIECALRYLDILGLPRTS